MQCELPDSDLIRKYVEGRCDESFKELFRRYFSLVYSAARQVTRDRDLACDVAQSVFVDFSRKAGGIAATNHVPGWLYRAAVFQASKLVRTEQRRRIREEACSHDPVETGERMDPEGDGIEVEAELNQALASLGMEDRKVLLLRFWKKMSARQVGQMLGMTEAAAQKRLTRAMEKLRCRMARVRPALELTILATLMHRVLREEASAAAANQAASHVAAERALSGQSWLAPIRRFVDRTLYSHRHAVASGLVGMNVFLVAGLIEPIDAGRITQPKTSSEWRPIGNGWANLSTGMSLAMETLLFGSPSSASKPGGLNDPCS